MNEPVEQGTYRVRLGTGKSCDIYEEVEFPGEWYYEKISKYVSHGPFQKPPSKVWLWLGSGWIA